MTAQNEQDSPPNELGDLRLRRNTILYLVTAALVLVVANLGQAAPWLVAEPQLRSRAFVLGPAVALVLALLVHKAEIFAYPRHTWFETVRAHGLRALADARAPTRWSFVITAAVTEELVFRGLLQNAWGIGWAALAYALLHAPRERTQWPWVLWMLAIGVLLGALTAWSGHIVPAIVAHLAIGVATTSSLARRIVREEAAPQATTTPALSAQASPSTTLTEAGPEVIELPQPLRAQPRQRPRKQGPRRARGGRSRAGQGRRRGVPRAERSESDEGTQSDRRMAASAARTQSEPAHEAGARDPENTERQPSTELAVGPAKTPRTEEIETVEAGTELERTGTTRDTATTGTGGSADPVQPAAPQTPESTVETPSPPGAAREQGVSSASDAAISQAEQQGATSSDPTPPTVPTMPRLDIPDAPDGSAAPPRVEAPKLDAPIVMQPPSPAVSDLDAELEEWGLVDASPGDEPDDAAPPRSPPLEADVGTKPATSTTETETETEDDIAAPQTEPVNEAEATENTTASTSTPPRTKSKARAEQGNSRRRKPGKSRRKNR